MKVLLIFFTAIFAVQSVPLESKWLNYKLHHEKNYAPTEDRLRFSIYQNNLRTIEEHNLKFEQGLVTYKMGINHFTDWTTEEFIQNLKKIPIIPEGDTLDYVGYLPEVFDWREKGGVTPVVSEGSCTSWIYSIVGSVEGANFVRTNQLLKFSEQCLKDCITYGCNSPPIDGYTFMEYHGLPVDANYPDPKVPAQCKYQEWDTGIQIKGWIKVEDGNETALQYATVVGGPVSVSVDASGFQFYHSGVFDYDQCSTDHLNHAVLVVGYDSVDNLDYWIVKNSWGADWGEEGYIRMSRNKQNQCGIATLCRVPILA